jgi:hypothetical protein
MRHLCDFACFLAKLGEIKIQVIVQAALNTTTPPEKTSQAAPKMLQEFKPPIVSRSCLSDLDQRLGVEQPADSRTQAQLDQKSET